MSTSALTIASYSRHCSEASRSGEADAARHVQVQRRGATFCARVIECAEFARDGAEWFKVRGYAIDGWVPAVRVRLCGATDGRCDCAFRAGVAVAEGRAAASPGAAAGDGTC